MDKRIKVTVLTDIRSVTLNMPCDNEKIDALEDMGELVLFRVESDISQMSIDDELNGSELIETLHQLNGIAEATSCFNDEDYKKFLAVCMFEHAFMIDDVDHCLDIVDEYDCDPYVNSYEDYFECYCQLNNEEFFENISEGSAYELGKMILQMHGGSLTEHGVICSAGNGLYEPLPDSEMQKVKAHASAAARYAVTAADKSEEKLFYNCDDEGIKAAKIGHLRMDFGNGRQFFSTWWDNGTGMNDGSFKRDLGRLIDSLRKTLLSDRSLMADFICKTDSLDLGDRGNGFKVQTDDNVFFLRCLPQAGEYDCYCYCYDRELLEQAMSQTDSEDMAEEESGDITMGGM